MFKLFQRKSIMCARYCLCIKSSPFERKSMRTYATEPGTKGSARFVDHPDARAHCAESLCSAQTCRNTSACRRRWTSRVNPLSVLSLEKSSPWDVYRWPVTLGATQLTLTIPILLWRWENRTHLLLKRERIGLVVAGGCKQRPPAGSQAGSTPCLRRTPPLDLSSVYFLNCCFMFVFVRLLQPSSPDSRALHTPVWSARNVSRHAAFKKSRWASPAHNKWPPCLKKCAFLNARKNVGKKGKSMCWLLMTVFSLTWSRPKLLGGLQKWRRDDTGPQNVRNSCM